MNAYDTAIRRRLDIIEGIGQDATKRQRSRSPMRSSPMRSSSTVNFNGQQGGLANFINAISGQESGGNYNARNRHSGALGRYQIMPGNISSWSRAALGRSVTPQQFARSPELQDRIARHQMQKYYQQYGPAGAAVAWYAGPGNANKYVRNPSGWNRKQGNYPSISSYVASILRRMGR